jgi:hypothetical protein
MRRYYTVVHWVFMLVALIMVGRPARADRGANGSYLTEKVYEQEKHIDHTDTEVGKVRDVAEESRSRLDRDEGIVLGINGLLGVLISVGALRGFNRGKASNG